MGVHTILTSYIPNPDPEALVWMQNFGSAVEARRRALGMVAEEVAALLTLIRDFEAKLAATYNPDTRTGPTITAKIMARNAATQAIQPLVRQIKARPRIAVEDKLSLGLRPGVKP